MHSQAIPISSFAITAVIFFSSSIGAQTSTYRLEFVRSYGAAEVASDLDEPAKRAGGAMLGSVVGIVQGGDATVYILDQSWHKIVAFAPDGELRAVILGGRGEGPGEFRLPVHLAITDDGMLAALDYELSRITLFDPESGGVAGQIKLPVAAPLRVFPGRGHFWIVRGAVPGSEAPLGMAVDAQGRRLSDLPALTPAERPWGGTVNFAVQSDGSVLIPSARPGLWAAWRAGRSESKGAELFPRLRPPVVRREPGQITVGSAEAETMGLVEWGDHVVILYVTQKLQARAPFPDPATVHHHLAIFRKDGSLEGTVDLPSERALVAKYLYVSPHTGHLFLAFREPYPVVEELRLVSSRGN